MSQNKKRRHEPGGEQAAVAVQRARAESLPIDCSLPRTETLAVPRTTTHLRRIKSRGENSIAPADPPLRRATGETQCPRIATEESVPSKQIGMLVHDPMSPWYTPCTGVRLQYGEATKVGHECQSDHRGSDPFGNGAIPLQVLRCATERRLETPNDA